MGCVCSSAAFCLFGLLCSLCYSYCERSRRRLWPVLGTWHLKPILLLLLELVVEVMVLLLLPRPGT